VLFGSMMIMFRKGALTTNDHERQDYLQVRKKR
jgi:hypothetical protein